LVSKAKYVLLLVHLPAHGRKLRAGCVSSCGHEQISIFCTATISETNELCAIVGGIGIYFGVAFALLCAVNILIFGNELYYLVQLVKMKRLRFDALSTSLVFAALASCFSALTLGIQMRLLTISPSVMANGEKDDGSRTIIGTVTYGLSFVFASFSYLNVSLIWIEIAESARVLRKKSSSNIQHYRSVLVVYYVIFVAVTVFGLASRSPLISVIPPAITSVLIAITYIMGFFKMRTMILTLLTSSSQGVAMSNQQSAGALRSNLSLIQTAALGVSCGCTIFLFNIGAWAYLGGFVDRPGASVNLIPLSFAWIGVTIAHSVVMRYLASNIRRKQEVTGAPHNATVIVSQEVRSATKDEAKTSSARVEASHAQNYHG
jgi:hypothetical protein